MKSLKLILIQASKRFGDWVFNWDVERHLRDNVIKFQALLSYTKESKKTLLKLSAIMYFNKSSARMHEALR